MNRNLGNVSQTWEGIITKDIYSESKENRRCVQGEKGFLPNQIIKKVYQSYACPHSCMYYRITDEAGHKLFQ